MKSWIRNGCVNCEHCAPLVEAEMASLDGNNQTAKKHYEQAIIAGGRRGFIHDHALANECFGAFFLRESDENEAAYHLRQAHALYSEWGALAKAKQLERKYPYIAFDS